MSEKEKQYFGITGFWLLLCLLVVCALGRAVNAEPLAAPGDLRLRHDLQLLSDSGLLNIPLTTWPVPWGDIANALADKKEVHGAALLASWRRVHHRIDIEFSNRLQLTTRLASAASPVRFRTFTDTPRSTLEAGTAMSLTRDHWAVHLEGTAVVRKPRDGRRWRPDGSYVSGILGNWIVSAGWQDRWWGPGWDGSLIMSTNSRPIPAISIMRNASDPFDLPVLNWLGPWQIRFFQGLLEGNRFVPHGLLTGIRFSFKPTSGLEIGISRAMQWGGRNRPHSLATFVRALIGSDNTGKLGVTTANQPGNQLAGFDLRWRSPIGDNLPYAFYSQMIGEDASSRVPAAYLGLFGVESWGDLGDSGASWRAHIEFARTTANLFSGDFHRLNAAYTHGVFRSGYRYYGRSIGHSIDGDGQAIALGATVVDTRGGVWEALFRSIRTNQDNISPGPVKIPAENILSLQLRSIQQFGNNKLTLGVGVNRGHLTFTNITDTVLHTELQWSSSF